MIKESWLKTLTWCITLSISFIFAKYKYKNYNFFFFIANCDFTPVSDPLTPEWTLIPKLRSFQTPSTHNFSGKYHILYVWINPIWNLCVWFELWATHLTGFLQTISPRRLFSFCVQKKVAPLQFLQLKLLVSSSSSS